jgi:hypothetical protein
MNLREVHWRVAPFPLALAMLGCGPTTNPPVSSCSLTGPPTMHGGTISASERWTRGIHLVTSSVSLASGAVLTIEGCSEVRVAPDANLSADNDGARIVAEGTAATPIRFVRSDPARPWGSLHAGFRGSLRLSNTTLEGGGGSDLSNDFAGATIAVRGRPEELPVKLHVDSVTVRGSVGLGVAMCASRFTPESTGLTITGSGSFPLYTGVDIATDLPTGSYTGNTTDEILLEASATYSNARPLRADAVLRNRGVPYRAATDNNRGRTIIVGDGRSDGPAALLEIEAGVTVRFPRGDTSNGVVVNGHLVGERWVPQGALVVRGTATAPVTFTSAAATPAAGDWVGLYFMGAVDPRTVIEHAVIAYAGADSQTRGVCASNASGDIDADSAVILYMQGESTPGRAFITNSTLRDSANGGIYRSWQGADLDFTATNTFERIAGCRQSGLRLAAGGCASPGCT